jgi:hypothetical protein
MMRRGRSARVLQSTRLATLQMAYGGLLSGSSAACHDGSRYDPRYITLPPRDRASLHIALALNDCGTTINKNLTSCNIACVV